MFQNIRVEILDWRFDMEEIRENKCRETPLVGQGSLHKRQ